MDDFSELVRCIRDCFGMETEEDYTCDCDNCLMKDKIEEHTDEDGEPYYTDYTGCESALGLAAADAIEELLRAAKKMHLWIFLNSGDEQAAYDWCGLSDEMNAALGYSGQFELRAEPPKEDA